MAKPPDIARLLVENDDLRARLEEAEATLDAIRRGEVDALVVAGVDGHRIYTLEGADQFYRVLIEAMQPGQGAATLSADGTILYCNRSFSILLGVPQEKVGGRRFGEFVHPPDSAIWADILDTANTAPSHGELRVSPQFGPPVPVHLALNALPLSGAVALGLVVTDLTERKQQEETARLLVREEAARAAAEQVARQARASEASVRESEARFRHLADALPQLVWMARPDGRFDYFNRRWFEFTGLSLEEAAADAWERVLHPNDILPCVNRWAEAVRTGHVFQFEFRLRDGKTGEYRWFLARAVPVRDIGGQIVRWFGTGTDIDDTKKAADRQRLLGEAVSVLLTTTEPDTMMRRLFAGIAPHLGLDTYFNYMLDESGETLQMLSCVGVPEETARSISRLELGQAVCGTVAIIRRAIVATDIQNSDDPKVQLVKSLGIRAYACNPLLAGERLLGTLSFASRTRDRFEPDEVEFLRTIADYVTVAHERVRLIRQLQDTDRRKDEFLATLAHELRNPLAPIRNAAQIIKLRGPTDPDLQSARAIIERQAVHLSRLVDDLLDVSRITRGKIVLQRERLPLALILTSALEASRPVIDAAGHELTVSLPPEAITLDGDLTRLAQVFGNLLVNAAKYTDRGGKIWLTARCEGKQVVVSVRDTGIGIDANHLPRVFEMFSQVDSALERTQGGLGIGLSLVKGLVTLHNGTVEARSGGPGKGSEFTVWLPVLGDPARLRSPSTPPPVGQASGPSYRILVADDNADATHTLSALLSVMGHDVTSAPDGQAAVELAENVQPHVIVLDIGMPRLNGYEAARRIRERPWAKRAVLVALTGWGQEEDKRRANEAGFDHHFTKPVAPDDLMALLRTLSPLQS